MKTKSLVLGTALSALAFVVTSPGVSAQLISGEVNEDLYFLDSVQFSDVELPGDLTADEGTTTASFEGAGSITIGSRRGGGFPRITLVGASTIKSFRDFSESTYTKEWWEGSLEVPLPGRQPARSDIEFQSGDKDLTRLQIIEAYTFGQGNEEMTFSPAAQVVVPAAVSDGQKLWIAYQDMGDGSWSVNNNDFCIVTAGLCYFEVGSVSAVALVKETFSQCPVNTIPNGQLSGPPNCIIQCNRGFALNDTATGCAAVDPDIDGGDDDLLMDPLTEDVTDYYAEDDVYYTEGPVYRPGYFRYRDTVRPNSRRAPGEGLEVEEEHTVNAEKDGFINYLLQMRNFFGEGSNSNVVTQASETEVAEEGMMGEYAEGEMGGEEQTMSAAPLLPSTGPKIFGTLAVVGILLMLLGGFRQRKSS